ncbi:MAG: GGDEF domain-containing protein [Lachnospiraceae bacterium]|nr:GGDEF domain-containing protein [Lachnospiraceae bacterium]
MPMTNAIRKWLKQYSQWFTPIILFLIAIAIFLAIFLNHTIDDSTHRAQAEVVADALLLERSVDIRLTTDLSMTKMMKNALSPADSLSVDDPGIIARLRDAVITGTGYMAVALDDNGKCVYSSAEDGGEIALSPDILDTIKALQPGDIDTFHITEDGMTDLNEDIGAVVCACAFEYAGGGKGYCAYFDSSWGELLAKTGKAKALMTIVNHDGKILMRSDVSDYFVRGDDYWKLIGGTASTTAKYHIIQHDDYAIYDATNGYTVIEIPLQGVSWAACISVSSAYINSLANIYFNSTRQFVIELIISVVVFFALLIILNLVSKIKRQKESRLLGDKADSDQLTGLKNKAATERDISEFMSANPTTQSLLFILDIDDFKGVNDTMGHSFGDDVLHEFGFSLSSMFRASDVIGRIGGDEFMVFVKNIPNEDTIEKEAKKIRDFISSFRAGEGVMREITASSGAAVFPADGDDFDTLYKAADKALYKSKRSGKRQLSFYGS